MQSDNPRMIANMRGLVAVCEQRGIGYELIPPTGNLLRVDAPGGSYYFANATTPLNSQSVNRICDDKYYTNALLQGIVRMPQTEAFLNPQRKGMTRSEEVRQELHTICREVEASLPYPLIVKPSRGYGGQGVSLVDDSPTLMARIGQIFDHNRPVALAQAYIPSVSEYRSIFLGGEHLFSYRKDNSGATFQGNLSPLHWQGARAVLVDDDVLLDQIAAFVAPLFAVLDVPFVGVDLLLDEAGSFWLLELNSAPGFAVFTRDCGFDQVHRLYEKILCDYLGCR